MKLRRQKGPVVGASGKVAEPASRYQLRLPLATTPEPGPAEGTDLRQRLADLLAGDLTFEGDKTSCRAHNVHAFAAKFPPQLPRLFIRELTWPGEWVVDPMAGSGTALVEAVIAGRRAVGVDLDPLACLIGKVKSHALDLPACFRRGQEAVKRAVTNVRRLSDAQLGARYPDSAVEFFRYWFEDGTVEELESLATAVRGVSDAGVRAFLKVIFSSVIITKSGGVTRARDLAHSRPHRDLKKRVDQSAIKAFSKKLGCAVEALDGIVGAPGRAFVVRGDARSLPLADGSAQLIVTSPPYAANAIDYMRAHKFSLMWLGHGRRELTELRSRYIGAERPSPSLEVPSEVGNRVLRKLMSTDRRRAAVVAHYFQDMEVSLREMLRITAKGRAAVLIVGSSRIRGIEIEAPSVLAELASSVGFRVVGIGWRRIVRDARMMPVSHRSGRQGIEARMHEEGVIGLWKPK
jgi:hypothetical protein